MNTQTPRCLTYAGETRTLRQWADWLATVSDTPPTKAALYSRLLRGWSIERLLTTPLLRHDRPHRHFAAAVARYLATQQKESRPCRI